jgi:hypothetical protein
MKYSSLVLVFFLIKGVIVYYIRVATRIKEMGDAAGIPRYGELDNSEIDEIIRLIEIGRNHDG